MYLQTAVTVLSVMRLAVSWDQGYMDEAEAEDTGRSVVYMSTYNCDLSPSVCPPENRESSHPTSCVYDNRRKEQIDYMQEDEISDVLCLQGVWYARDVEAILAGTNTNFPYAYSFLHNSNGELNSSLIHHPPCDEEDAKILKIIDKCEFEKCHSSALRNKIFKCIEEVCSVKNIMRQMSASCLGCIFQGTKRGNFAECTESEYAFNPSGLLVLSRYKILQSNHVLYHPTNLHNKQGQQRSNEIIQRGYLDLEVNHIGRVICTHLTEKFGDEYVEVSNAFRNYKQKNFDEFRTLYNVLRQDQRAIVMGDLNASPSLTKGNIAPQFPENLEILRDIGFQDPVSNSHKHTEVDCSYCCGNLLVKKSVTEICAGSNPSIGYIFDHVMIRGYDIVETQDFLKKNAVLRIFLLGRQGGAMSRHYGFSVPIIVR